MTIYSLNVLLSQYGTSLLFQVQFYLLLQDLHTAFSGGRSGCLIFPSLEEFSTVCYDMIHTVKGFSVVSEAELDVFLEFLCFLYDPTNVDNLISGSSAISKSSLNIWKFMDHILLKPGLENPEYYVASM